MNENLDELKSICGILKKESAEENSWQVIRPGRLRKVYGAKNLQERWVLQPEFLQMEKEPRPKSELEAHCTKQPAYELYEAVRQALGQLQVRAYCGDRAALKPLVVLARTLVKELEILAEYQPEITKELAQTYPDWPVLLSLNDQDKNKAGELLAKLEVGTKALLPTRTGQRIDRRNLWTRYAEAGLKACQQNKLLVPSLIEQCKGITPSRESLLFWRKPVWASFYNLSDGSTIILPDWKKDCLKLTGPITAANFHEWWKAIQLYILEYWQTVPEDYREAIKKIQYDDTSRQPSAVKLHGENTEARQRAHALHQIQKALRSLLSLPVRQQPPSDT